MDELEQQQRRGRTLGDYIGTPDAKTAISRLVGSNPIASEISQDEAARYRAMIRQLFPGEEEYMVDLALAIWGIRNGVGGLDDYANKSPIVVGSKSVPAHKIFGDILPLGVEGIPRKFFSASYEQYVPQILASSVELRNSLQSRVAKAGLKPGMELYVVDYVRGNVSATAGMSGERDRAKNNLIRRKNAAGRIPGDESVPMAVAEVQRGSTTFDPHASSSLY